MTVQSLIFDRRRFSKDTAKSWALEHGYRADDFDIAGGYIHLRQIPLSKCEGTPETIDFQPGIQARVCGSADQPSHHGKLIPPKPQQEKIMHVSMNTESISKWLGLKQDERGNRIRSLISDIIEVTLTPGMYQYGAQISIGTGMMILKPTPQNVLIANEKNKTIAQVSKAHVTYNPHLEVVYQDAWWVLTPETVGVLAVTSVDAAYKAVT